MWTRGPACENVVTAVWNGSNNTSDSVSIHTKISRCAEDLVYWNNDCFGNINRNLKYARMKLDSLQQREQIEVNVVRQKLIEQEIDELLYREELMWKQSSRALWLMEVDKNTKFFHSKAS